MNTSRILLWFSFSLVICSGCKNKHEILYGKIRKNLDQIKIIDTHEHQGFPWKLKHNAFDIGMYMYTDLICSGMIPYSDSMEMAHNPTHYWEYTNEYLRFSRATSYHAQFIKNLQKMYGLTTEELSKEEYLRISSDIDANFNDYEPWLTEGLQKCNIDYMLVDRVWDPFNPIMEHEKFGYVFRFDRLVLDAVKVAEAKRITDKKALELIDNDELEIYDFDDYLTFIDAVLAALLTHDVVAFKMGLAYHRSLDFEKVTIEEAKRIFSTSNPDTLEIKKLEDFLVYYIVEKAGSMNLTVQIHTGYLHGNYGQLDRSNPMKLLSLIKSNTGTKFVLFHGGYPWISEFIVIGKNYPNVYLDLVWLPQLSMTKAISVFHEMLDAVPYNKICWGGDVGKIDETAGSLEMGKEVTATVLAERIERGWMSENIAEDICRRVFRENAIEIYNLEEMLD